MRVDPGTGGNPRLRLAAVALSAAALVLAGCGGDETGGSGGSTAPAESAPDPAAPPAATPTATDGGSADDGSSQASPAAETQIAIEDGEPVGGETSIVVKKGDPVAFSVTSDAAGTIHVHGYELEQAVAPDQPARFDFTADIDGIYEIEAHGLGAGGSDLELGTLRVNP